MKTRPADLEAWVLAGQSNMQGCGWLKGVLEPDERVWNFTSAGRWEVAKEPLHRLWESFTPVHKDMMRQWQSEADRKVSDREWARREDATRKQGSGLGIAFGKAMADALGRPVGLIAAAHGGTSLDQWSPKQKDRGGKSLYGGMLERIRKAGVRPKGILWYQGESDAFSMDTGRTYAERLDQWVAAVRKDTGVRNLPVIAVQIGRVIEPADRQGVWPGWDLVREALRTLPERVPHTAVTSAVDLPLVDIIHVDTPALIRLGHRMARLALGLAGAGGAAAGPEVARIRRAVTPGDGKNAVRVEFRGVTGRWTRRENLRGFACRTPEHRVPLFPINAWVEADNSVFVTLNREPDKDARLGYGLGLDPVCELVDEADMPLCSFLPRPIKA